MACTISLLYPPAKWTIRSHFFMIIAWTITVSLATRQVYMLCQSNCHLIGDCYIYAISVHSPCNVPCYEDIVTENWCTFYLNGTMWMQHYLMLLQYQAALYISDLINKIDINVIIVYLKWESITVFIDEILWCILLYNYNIYVKVSLNSKNVATPTFAICMSDNKWTTHKLYHVV